MTIKIYDKYSLDENGNVYSGEKIIKPYLSRGYYQIMIGRKCTSYAKLIATFLVYNENHYERLIYIDGNPENCVPSNLKWVSEEEYHKKQSRTKSRTDLSFMPDYEYFNNIFLEAYKTMKGKRKYYLAGKIYLDMFEKYVRGGVKNLRAEIFIMYKFSVGQERRMMEDKNITDLEKYLIFEKNTI
jgi:hypothetical protein